ncbi:LOW QUALITY PROTEIN: hypothetical protein RvY_15447 [Ramazzottius varieornatus]|uniref:Uncharacterized protein n=1 Tax=Ramazzottius varieornatus TaxID=947166 RepID=A0A1D1VUY0_RAMVA|nr:LOW QUALITY PROTEIN: hypothetical protein RvY_15447 [Ramazzottius varieornatus]
MDFDDSASMSSVASTFSTLSIARRMRGRLGRSVLASCSSGTGDEGKEEMDVAPASQVEGYVRGASSGDECGDGENPSCANGQGGSTFPEADIEKGTGVLLPISDMFFLPNLSSVVNYPNRKPPRCSKCRLDGHTCEFCGEPWSRRRGTARDVERSKDYLKEAATGHSAVREQREKRTHDRPGTEPLKMPESWLLVNEKTKHARLNDREKADSRKREDRLAREREDKDMPG